MILQVKDLSVQFEKGFSLHPICFSVEEGEIVTIVGESGSGKSTLAKAVTAMNDDNARVTGEVLLNGKSLYAMAPKELRQLRQREFAIAFQNSRELLNPLLTIRSQLTEILKKAVAPGEREPRLQELLQVVGLEEDVLDQYPRELSGGMISRILLISAICLHPKLVVLDEPTGALDVASRHRIIHLILDIHQQYGIAFLVITHDFSLAEHISSHMLILCQGHLVEEGNTTEILRDPLHPYSRGLINSSMEINLYRDICGIRPAQNRAYTACPFYDRCPQRLDRCKTETPVLQPHSQVKNRRIACNRGGIVTILEGAHLSRRFGKKQVLDDVSLSLQASEVTSIVGESGEGKTTLCNLLSGYDRERTGTVLFEGEPADFRQLLSRKRGMQMIFQDPYTSVNQNLTVYEAVSEPLRINYPGDPIRETVQAYLRDVGLPDTEAFLSQRIRTLSGGQQQRVSVARALTMEPKVLIADEPTSMQDPSTTANLLRMLQEVQNKNGLTMLLITHDLSCALKISHKIFQLAHGRLSRVLDGEALDRRLLHGTEISRTGL